MSKKIVLIVVIIVTLVLGVGLYIRQTFQSRQNCNTYYDKTGTKVLSKVCQTENRL